MLLATLGFEINIQLVTSNFIWYHWLSLGRCIKYSHGHYSLVIDDD